jgi:DNA-binding NtrC family response regulator
MLLDGRVTAPASLMSTRLGTTVRSEPAPLPPGAAPQRWSAVVAHSPDPAVIGQAFDLSSREIHIGREPPPGPHVRITLPDQRMSRLHASLLIDGGSARATDCASSNGLFVDGRRRENAPVDDGSVLRLGDTLLVIERGEPAPGKDDAGLGMIGRSPAMAALRTLIRGLAPSPIAALIVGETGAGKELVARALHQQSQRPGPFVPINCAAIPQTLMESTLFGHRKGAFTGASTDREGAFGRAHRGTLFLDEIGELQLESQPKLLRVLEDGEVTAVGAGRPARVDVRIVSATNRPLDSAVAVGRFREDLLARLAGVTIEMPALRDRRGDVLPLFHAFARGTDGGERAISADFAEALLLAPWPQNVRALAKLAERLRVLHGAETRWEVGLLEEGLRDRVLRRDEDDHEAAPQGDRDASNEITRPPTREELLALLERFRGNVSLLAAHARRNRKQVYRWMDDLGIERGTGR